MIAASYSIEGAVAALVVASSATLSSCRRIQALSARPLLVAAGPLQSVQLPSVWGATAAAPKVGSEQGAPRPLVA